jgi:putative N6-adenine-specific DNA methylase
MSECFAVCAPGLESFTACELRQIGLLGDFSLEESDSERLSIERADSSEEGGIGFNGGLEAIYRANLNLRTASRVLVRLGDFYATAFYELRKKASCLPW